MNFPIFCVLLFITCCDGTRIVKLLRLAVCDMLLVVYDIVFLLVVFRSNYFMVVFCFFWY